MRDGFRREVARHRLDGLEPFDSPRRGAELDETLVEQRVHDRQQKRRVGARSDEVVLTGDLRGLGPSRIDDDHLAAALADGLQPARRIRHRHQTAVRHRRVGADDQ